MHAQMHLKGYSVNNHVCLGYYIRDILKNDWLFRSFDDCRLKRNSLVYYGKMMHTQVAQDSIRTCKECIEKILELTDEEG
jgi:hypothetical protein